MLLIWAYLDPTSVIEYYKKSQMSQPDFKDFNKESKKDCLLIAGCITAYGMVGLVIFVLGVILPVKYMTHRTRPTRIITVKRHINMRIKEGNQPAHPSGDAAVAAFFFGLYFYVFDFPYLLYIFLPLVSLGRVWMMCHWFGDVIVGAICGVGFMILWYHESMFGVLSSWIFKIWF